MVKNAINLSRLPLFVLSSAGILLTTIILGLMVSSSLADSMMGSTFQVCPSGPPNCDFDTIQDAVDAANEGDLIKVAEGSYAGVQGRPAPTGYQGPGVVSQMVFLTKTLTIRGGYSTSDWTSPDTAAHPTTLDAQGQGRVLFVAGEIAPIIEGLRLTGGDASDLGGTLLVDAGGGVYVLKANATINDCTVFENIAGSDWGGSGGGLFLSSSPATLRANIIRDNVASTGGEGYGGGLALDNSAAAILGNKVFNNVASSKDRGFGGGVDLFASDATLNANEIYGNTASKTSQGYGGGVHVDGSAAEVTHNSIRENIASAEHDGFGGGMHFSKSGGIVRGNRIIGNSASASTSSYGYGGGLDLFQSSSRFSRNVVKGNSASSGVQGFGGGLNLSDSQSQMVNNVIINNQAGGKGAGFYIGGSDVSLTQTTIAGNTNGDGSGLYLASETVLTLKNTILANQTTGVYVDGNSTAHLDGVLWNGNRSNYEGAGVSVSNALTGSPVFAADGYHILDGSAAIDAGIDANVGEDIDGETRPNQIADLGADEYWPSTNATPTPTSTPVPGADFYIYLPMIVGR